MTEEVNYKHKYKTLKTKLKFLVYENISFQEELKKCQRRLLKISRDKSFLLDRLLKYEKTGGSSSESEETASSGSEAEKDRKAKKRKMTGTMPPFGTSDPMATLAAMGYPGLAPPRQVKQAKTADASKRKKTMKSSGVIGPVNSNNKKPSPSTVIKSPPQSAPPLQPHLSTEEIESHFQSRKTIPDLVPEKAPLTVPQEMFSGMEEAADVGLSPANPEEDSLIIDLPDSSQ